MNAQLAPVPWSGIYPSIPAEEYHQRALDIASASGLKQMLRSPAHFRHWVKNPDEDDQRPVLAFGKALHCAILEPDVFGARYCVLPPGAPARPTAAMLAAKKNSESSLERIAFWERWDADNAGRTILTADDYERVQRMGDSVRAHPVAAGLLVGGQREITLRWEDEATGLRCQARPDLYLPGEFVMDVKTCRDASEEGFARAVHNYLYDLGEAHYLEGIRANGDSIRYFIFLAIESTAPFVCQPCVIDAKAEQRGYTLRTRAMNRQAECLKSGRWPGYSERLLEIHLPAFAYYGIEE